MKLRFDATLSQDDNTISKVFSFELPYGVKDTEASEKLANAVIGIIDMEDLVNRLVADLKADVSGKEEKEVAEKEKEQ
jgi:hypothetical protein